MEDMRIESPKPKTGVIVTAVMASAAIFGGLGYYIGSMYETAPAGTVTYASPSTAVSSAATAKASPATSASTSTAAVTDETASWKTFTSTEHKYLFKYPPTLTDDADARQKIYDVALLAANTSGSAEQVPQFAVRYYATAASLPGQDGKAMGAATLDAYFAQLKPSESNTVMSAEKATVGSYSGYHTEESNIGGLTYYYVEHNKAVYKFQVETAQKSTYEKIFASLKFTK